MEVDFTHSEPILVGDATSGSASGPEGVPEGESSLLDELANLRLRVLALETQLRQRDARIRHFEAHTAQAAEGIAWLRAEVGLRDERLRGFERSPLWRARKLLRRSLGAARRLLRAGGVRLLAGGVRVARPWVPPPLRRALTRLWSPWSRLMPLEAALRAEASTQRTGRVWRAAARGAAVPSTSTYDIVCFAIIDWEFRWQRPQQVLSALAAAGHRVFLVNSNHSMTPGGDAYLLRPLAERVWEVLVPFQHPLDIFSRPLHDDEVETVLAALAALAADVDIGHAVSLVQIASWRAAAAGARARFGWPTVYDCMDEWRTFPGIAPPILEEEAVLAAEADLLVVTAEKLSSRWREEGLAPLLVRNAADFDRFHGAAPSELLQGMRGPVLGYFGAIADWFDIELVAHLARQRPQYHIVLLGGIFDVDVDVLLRLPNVHLLGQQPYETMPAYLRRFDVCLIPFRINAVTAATDPVKFYEYVSQGKPVVSTDLPELHGYRHLLYVAADREDFVRQVDLAVAESDPPARQARIALARANTWSSRVETLRAAIRERHRQVSLVVVTRGSLEYLRQCLESLLGKSLLPNVEVVVVDNGSSDGTAHYLSGLVAQGAPVRVITNAENRGFAAGVNQGLMAAGGEHLVVLNDDVVVPHGWLPRLTRHLADPRIGLLGAVTNFSGNESRIKVPYTLLDDLDVFAAARHRRHGGRLFDIRVVAMYCLAMRRDVWERLGPLDEGFAIGLFEDDDYAHRARLAGYRVVCAEDAFVHHFGQVSFNKLPLPVYLEVWRQNQARYEQKWGTAWEPHRLRPDLEGEAV